MHARAAARRARVLYGGFALLLATACGRGNVYGDPTTTGMALFDCESFCESSAQTLVTYFGVVKVDCAGFENAETCEACDALFETRFGVRINGRTVIPAMGAPSTLQCP